MASLYIEVRKPRYVVQELSGWEISRDGTGRRGPHKTSFYIMDLLDNAKVVYRVEAGAGAHQSVGRMKQRALRICNRMNNDYDHSVERENNGR